MIAERSLVSFSDRLMPVMLGWAGAVQERLGLGQANVCLRIALMLNDAEVLEAR